MTDPIEFTPDMDTPPFAEAIIEDAPMEEVVPMSDPDPESDGLAIEDTTSNQQTPLAGLNSFKPDEQATIIGEITPANFDNLMKILNVLIKEKATDRIVIRDSKISQLAGSYTVMADMTSVLSYQGKYINLDIVNPKKYVALFGQFRDQDNIFITDDTPNNRFIITNGEIELFLPKVDSTTDDLDTDKDFSTATKISERNIDKDTRKIIKSLGKDEEYIEYLVQDSQIKAMHIPNTAKYVYQDFKNDDKAKKLDETNSDLTLRTSGFLPVDADNYHLTIYQLADGNYISVTTCKIGGQIDVTVIEDCNVTTGGNLIF